MEEPAEFFVIVDARAERLLLIRTEPPQSDVLTLPLAIEALRHLGGDSVAVPESLIDLAFLLAGTPTEDQGAIREAQTLLEGSTPGTAHVVLPGGESTLLFVSRRNKAGGG